MNWPSGQEGQSPWHVEGARSDGWKQQALIHLPRQEPFGATGRAHAAPAVAVAFLRHLLDYFGPRGEGYVRISGFNTPANIETVVERLAAADLSSRAQPAGA